MKLAVLFSGGKDSFLSLKKAIEKEEVACLISIESKNEESYMFHVPNIHLAKMHSESLGIPLIKVYTHGEKEEELEDLKDAIKLAIENYGAEGIISGAIGSTYQSTRIQTICNDLDIWCFNPLWQRDQISILKELIDNDVDVIIAGISAYPLEKNWLGKKINQETLEELKKLAEDFKINPAGEGGEFETLVLDSPLHKKRIKIIESKIEYENYAGTLNVIDAKLVEKC